MTILIITIPLLLFLAYLRQSSNFEIKTKSRRDYYHDYLKTDAWQRKRYVVFKRDNWRCVHCSAQATQVHHKRYARMNISREPIAWFESVCRGCHEALHSKRTYAR